MATMCTKAPYIFDPADIYLYQSTGPRLCCCYHDAGSAQGAWYVRGVVVYRIELR